MFILGIVFSLPPQKLKSVQVQVIPSSTSEEMKKVVLKLYLHDDKGKKKAMKSVSGLSGIVSIAMDMKEKKLTVVGDVDPVDVVGKLRKAGWSTEILTVGPAKEEKKDQGKKDEGKKDEGKKKTVEEQVADLVKAYKAYNPHMTQYYHVVSAEENPNYCVIC